MTLVGFLGILLGLVAWSFAMMDRTRLRAGVFVLLFLAHVLCGFIYHSYAVNFGSDAGAYYFGLQGYDETEFGLSTQFVIFLVYKIKSAVGGSYLDFFLLFQSFGFFGIALLMRATEEIYANLQLPQPVWTYLLLFLPGIHFWTSAIGKDALLFTASCLMVWGAMNLRRRYISVGIAIGIMILVRPHIALIALIAVAWTLLKDRSTTRLMRGALIVGSIAGLALAADTMKSTFALDVTSADSISDFLAVRDNVIASSSSDEVGNTAVLNAPFPVKVVSFLFRPLFMDAEGAFGYIASLENTVFLVIFASLMFRIRTVIAAVKAAPFLRYASTFFVGVTIVLSIDYYNVGLGLRQKTMVAPAILIMFIAISAVREAQQRAAELAQPIRARLRPV